MRLPDYKINRIDELLPWNCSTAADPGPFNKRAQNSVAIIAKNHLSRCVEQMRAMPSEIGQMSATDAPQGKLIVNAEGVPVFLGELGREKNRALVGKRNQAGIEGGIEVSGKQETVVDVEPLGIGFAFGPRLYVTGAQ